MRSGLCASFQQIASLSTPTIDYLEESVVSFLMPESSQADFEAHLAEARRLAPVPIETANLFLPADLALVATPERPVDTRRLEQYVRTALRRAEQAGIRLIVFGSGKARVCPEGYAHNQAVQQIADHLARWGPWASQHGVQIALEPLRYEETNMLNTVAESGALVAQIATPGVSLLVDTYHMASNREDPLSILSVAPFIAHVHVAELEGRRAPGTHQEDLRPYFRALRQAGYDGRISLECNWQQVSTELAPAIATLHEQWDASAPR